MRKPAMEHYNKPLVKREQKTLMKTKPRPAAKSAPNPVALDRKPVTGGHKYKTSEHISAKLVQKTVSKVKRLVKTEQKPAKPEQKTTLPEKKSAPTAALAESKKEMKPAPVDPEPDGHYELNPLITRMLESELQDIMIKVWQELPDEPLSVAEKLVTDKLRNEAGDDLRNVLGLNITKRLLNVYNPLFVKAEFSKRPESKHVKAFLHEFGGDRLLANNVIQMKNIADFDRICSTKGIRCGDAKVNIIPCYKFMRCPSKLKTVYSDINAAEKKKITETAEINNEGLKIVDKVKIETKPDSESANETKVSAEKSKTDNPALIKTVDLKNNLAPEDRSIPDKPELTKTVDLKSKPDSEKKSVPEKTESTTTSDLKNKQDSEDKTIPEKPALTKTADLKNKSDSEEKSLLEKSPLTKTDNLKNKPDTKEKPEKLLKVDPQVSKNKPSSINTAPKEKDAEINKTKKSNDLDNLKITKKATDIKTVNMKKMEGKITKNNDRINKILASDSKNDDDELDDEDILALISEGIVLDECSGSDGE